MQSEGDILRAQRVALVSMLPKVMPKALAVLLILAVLAAGYGMSMKAPKSLTAPVVPPATKASVPAVPVFKLDRDLGAIPAGEPQESSPSVNPETKSRTAP